jgi:aminopeptidase N
MRRTSRKFATVLVLALLLPAGSAQAAEPYVDPLLPGYGDTAIDMTDYHVRIDWHAGSGKIAAVARIKALTTTTTDSVELDLDGLRVDGVMVDGTATSWTRSGHRLHIALPQEEAAGTSLEVAVTYHGEPRIFTDPDGATEGWGQTKDGIVALGEPVGTMTWLPISNVPADKTPMAITVTAPQRFEVASNGRLVAVTRSGSLKTWRYDASTMAPYLAMVSIGQFAIHRTATDSGVKVLSFIDPTKGALRHQVRLVPTAVDWLAKRIGTPYPFGQAGIVVDPNRFGYALETQTRPVFPHVPGDLTIVHEMAHQWFGDSVTPRQWDDLWLNEGFATYMEWCWLKRVGRSSPAQEFARRYAGHRHDPDFWTPSPHRLGSATNLFAYHVTYLRSAMTLQALRERVGSGTFWRIARVWTRTHADGNGTTEQFERLAERTSGRDLHRLFTDWLDRHTRPQGYARDCCTDR